MPILKYAETLILPGGWRIGPDAIASIAEHIGTRGYSMHDIGELYIRQTDKGLHVNYKLYEREDGKEEASKIGDGGHSI